MSGLGHGIGNGGKPLVGWFSFHPCWSVSPGCRGPAGIIINVQQCSFGF